MLPKNIKLHRRSGILELIYPDISFKLSAEFLRVHSPSAEVRGHAPGQEVLQFGKSKVLIKDIVPVGNYALRLVFDDGHDSGLYTWSYFLELGKNQPAMWQKYLENLKTAGKSREALPEGIQAINIQALKPD
jgi:DUF971 family protein